jgi:hypothetical protein
MHNTTITMKYTNEEELEERFGTVNNPFISPPSALGLNRIMVFDVQIASTMPIVVQLNRLELQFGGKNKNPMNRFHLSQFWANKIRESESHRGWNSRASERGAPRFHGPLPKLRYCHSVCTHFHPGWKTSHQFQV